MKRILTFGILVLFSLPAHAIDNEALLEGAKLCTRYMPRYEREYGIPTHLLGAIATTETGRFHDGLKIRVPWPWTINAEGKGYFYDSKEQAMAAARRMQAQGIQSMDIGCMQVNLHHHAKAFANLDEAFDPQMNVAYAASFLRSLFQQSNSWKQASADYHSKEPMRGSRYVDMVYNSWQTIIEKLRLARQQVPGDTALAMNDAAAAPVTAPVPPKTEVPVSQLQPAQPKLARLPEQAGKKLAGFHSPRMNSIRVSTRETASTDSSSQGIIVVKPEIKVVDDEPVQTASLSSSAYHPAPDTAKIIRLDNTRVIDTTAAPQRGPRFIFTD